ncbi:hypothetical protein [Archangium sp.]|uniref:hypothetical protein n=1 Tax=Archangium sp. TaxID=1872627 RepID=UPI003899EECD
MGWVLLALCVGSTGAHAAPWSHLRELSVMAGGGVEGYTLALAPRVDPGVTYGVAVGVRPQRLLGLDVGLEVGYAHARNGLDTRRPRDVGTGDFDLVRDGAYAAASVGLRSSTVQPYVLGGLGFSVYNVRGTVQGFGDNIVGSVPVGGGLRASFGSLTAEARLQYDVLFDQRYPTGAPVQHVGGRTPLTIGRGGRYAGRLNLGVAW